MAATNSSYRKGVGIMLVNKNGLILAGQRIDCEIPAWQMPQGGMHEGEAPLQAAFRELYEEVMVPKESVELIAESKQWLKYDLPKEMINELWDGMYIGQIQKWFLMRFLGNDSDIKVDTANQEFKSWQWVTQDLLIDSIIDFKKELYLSIIAELYCKI
ncbi:MAG: RNA pyrophosphohydrolase [Candidatus Lariskella arthropodorum]